MRECNIRFDKNRKVKSEDIKNLEKFFSEENLEKFESDEVFAVEATEHMGNGEYKAVGYDFMLAATHKPEWVQIGDLGILLFVITGVLLKMTRL